MYQFAETELERRRVGPRTDFGQRQRADDSGASGYSGYSGGDERGAGGIFAPASSAAAPSGAAAHLERTHRMVASMEQSAAYLCCLIATLTATALNMFVLDFARTW